uniref:Uncharacterized protein n=1 Tax=Anguilla anguilla TaxID=7936 RepID=A0A0E9PN95_ANGAN
MFFLPSLAWILIPEAELFPYHFPGITSSHDEKKYHKHFHKNLYNLKTKWYLRL